MTICWQEQIQKVSEGSHTTKFLDDEMTDETPCKYKVMHKQKTVLYLHIWWWTLNCYYHGKMRIWSYHSQFYVCNSSQIQKSNVEFLVWIKDQNKYHYVSVQFHSMTSSWIHCIVPHFFTLFFHYIKRYYNTTGRDTKKASEIIIDKDTLL